MDHKENLTSESIKSERIRRGLTQIKAAGEMEISLSSLRSIEQGGKIGIVTGIQIAEWMKKK